LCPALAALGSLSGRIPVIHTHRPDLMIEVIRLKERQMNCAAATVGKFSQVEVLSKVKKKVYISEQLNVENISASDVILNNMVKKT
jgi:hypothetical protein